MNRETQSKIREALESGIYALAHVEENGRGNGVTLAAEGILREALALLDAESVDVEEIKREVRKLMGDGWNSHYYLGANLAIDLMKKSGLLGGVDAA
jgi:hypothetical protein